MVMDIHRQTIGISYTLKPLCHMHPEGFQPSYTLDNEQKINKNKMKMDNSDDFFFFNSGWFMPKKSSAESSTPAASRGFHGMAAVGRLGTQLHPLRRVHAAGTGMQHGVHARLLRATDGDAWAIISPQKPTAPGCGNKMKEDLCGFFMIFPCFFFKHVFFMGKITLKGKRERDLLKKGRDICG